MAKVKKNLFSTTPGVVKKGTAAMLCVILSGLFLVAGCKKDDEKKDSFPKDIPFTEYSLAETCQWQNLAYDDKVIIINSEEQLSRYIAGTGSGYPEVDFAKQTLLLANGKSSGIVSEITVTDLQQLSANEYELDIELNLNIFAVVEEWAIALIVEKVSEESKVNLITATVETEFTLRGTTWVLVGFVDVETGEMKEVEPKDFKGLYSCYTFEFDTDTTFLSISTTNDINGSYEVDYTTNNIRFFDVRSTAVGELGNGDLYYYVWRKIQSFSLKKNELWLYYNDNKNYLLFRSIEGVLANTNWKLTGFEDMKTGEIHPPEPTDENVFLLTFNGYFIVDGFTSSNQFAGRYYFYEETSSFFIRAGKITDFDESPDGYRYFNALGELGLSFSLQENELKLFYNYGMNCLIFKKI